MNALRSESALPPPAPRRPQSRRELFMACTILALQGFGGVMAVVQSELVERRQWYSVEEFVEDWAVAQVLPGPNALNLVMSLGGRYFGASGALAAVAGMLLAPSALVLLLAVGYAHIAAHPAVQGALRGMGAVAAGLVLATGLKLAAPLRHNLMGLPACIMLTLVAFIGATFWHWPLMWVIGGLGGLAFAWALWRLR